MKIVLQEMPQQTLEDFADKHGLQMRVNERDKPIGDKSRYYARFDGVDVMDKGMLVGTYGNGSTPEEAIADYANVISMKRIAVDAYTKSRREIDVPRLIGGQ